MVDLCRSIAFFNVIGLLYPFYFPISIWDEYYNKEDTEKPGECEVIVAKHRSGPTGSVDVAWIERYTQFKDKASGNIPDAGGMF